MLIDDIDFRNFPKNKDLITHKCYQIKKYKDREKYSNENIYNKPENPKAFLFISLGI